MRHVQLLVLGLKIELHLDLPGLELTQEVVAFGRLVNCAVEEVKEADDGGVVLDAQVDCRSIVLDERNALPGVPDVIFFIDRGRGVH